MAAWTTSTIKAVLKRLGYDVRRSRFHFVDAFEDQARLLRTVSEPLIFDVGANTGQTMEAYRKVFPGATLHCFEPFPAAFDELRRRFGGDSRAHLHRIAVSDANGIASLRVMRISLLNSLLQMLPDDETYQSGIREVGRIQVNTVALDDFCSQEGVARIDILKLDIQGNELAALKGASGLLAARKIDTIFVEVVFTPMYEGQSTFSGILDLMTSYSYRLYGLYDFARQITGVLGWCNAVFIGPQVFDRLPKTFWQ